MVSLPAAAVWAAVSAIDAAVPDVEAVDAVVEEEELAVPISVEEQEVLSVLEQGTDKEVYHLS